MDIQEGNIGSFVTTAHVAADPNGVAAGYWGGVPGVWSGPRDFNATQYGPGAAVIDTRNPFQVGASFPVDPATGLLASVEMQLSQGGRSLGFSLAGYAFGGGNGFEEITAALEQGMTPVVSYWSSYSMDWLDGSGSDGQGFCEAETPAECGSAVTFSGLQVTAL